jgi:protein SCO1/2
MRDAAMIVTRSAQRRAAGLASVAAAACLGAVSLLAQPSLPTSVGRPTTPAGERPRPLEDVGFDQRLEARAPLDLLFRDETGQPRPLKDFFVEGRPVVLALVYFDCPMLCTQVQRGFLSALKALSFDAGREFQALSISFDPRETPALAQSRKVAMMEDYGRPTADAGWRFLTGDQAAIEQLTSAVGFRYAWDPPMGQFAHPSGLIVLTPDGRVSRYFFGIEYSPRDLRLGLVEASEGRIGSVVDHAMLFCYQYDPTTGKYGAVAMKLVRLGGVATVAGLGGFILLARRRERRLEQRTRAAGPGVN